jgi:large conductance mechanosensitive channel
VGLLADFKKFALKGNVIDLAVAVVIGGAFQKIITVIVATVIMPIVSLVMPKGDWRGNGWTIKHGATPSQDVIIRYGELLGAILDFIIIAFVLFLIVSKIVKRIEERFSKPEVTTKECPFCIETIPLQATRCKFCTSQLTTS